MRIFMLILCFLAIACCPVDFGTFAANPKFKDIVLSPENPSNTIITDKVVGEVMYGVVSRLQKEYKMKPDYYRVEKNGIIVGVKEHCWYVFMFKPAQRTEIIAGLLEYVNCRDKTLTDQQRDMIGAICQYLGNYEEDEEPNEDAKEIPKNTLC